MFIVIGVFSLFTCMVLFTGRYWVHVLVPTVLSSLAVIAATEKVSFNFDGGDARTN